MTSTPNTPVVNPGLLYLNNLELGWTDATHITVAAGAARDSNNVNDIILNAPVTNTGTTVGANGVDIAVITGTQFYRVYVIADSTGYQPTASLLSLNTTAPSLPYGYDMFRGIGYVKVSSGSILQFWQYGHGGNRVMYYDVGIAAPTTATAGAFTEISLAAGVPPIACQVILDVTYTPATAANKVEFLPFGSTATAGIVRLSGVVGSVAQVMSLTVPSQLDVGVPSIKYKFVTSDTLTLLISGYEEYFT